MDLKSIVVASTKEFGKHSINSFLAPFTVEFTQNDAIAFKELLLEPETKEEIQTVYNNTKKILNIKKSDVQQNSTIIQETPDSIKKCYIC